MASRVKWPLIGVLAAGVLVVACGGGATPTSPAGADPTPAAATDAPPAPADSVTVPEVNSLTDFGDVCRGVRLSGATAYDPARAGVHPLVTVAGEPPDYSVAGFGLPDEWDPVSGQEQTVELVVCLDRVASTFIQTCTGYKDDDDQETGRTVELYDATYDVRLVAATTGEVVAQTQLEAAGDSCPMVVYFKPLQTVRPWYAEPTNALTEWLVPLVQT